jgi:hypothetical protein
VNNMTSRLESGRVGSKAVAPSRGNALAVEGKRLLVVGVSGP